MGRHVDVDPADAHEILQMLDKDSSGQLDASEFLTGCITLFGPSRAIDTARILDDLLEVKLWLVSHANQFTQNKSADLIQNAKQVDVEDEPEARSSDSSDDAVPLS